MFWKPNVTFTAFIWDIFIVSIVVYSLLLLYLYSNASFCYFLATCVVPLCTIRLPIMGCCLFLHCRLRFSLSMCRKRTTPHHLFPFRSLFFPLRDENHYGCLLIKQALNSGRLKPLQLAREQRTWSENKNTLLCIHMPFNQGEGFIKSINKMCVSALEVNT